MLKDKNLYCVGGYIRDEILGIKNFDIDYCYQGNAIEFTKDNFQVIKENPSFGTVKAFAENIEADVKSVKSAYALFKKYRSGKNTQMACEDYLQLSNVVDSYFCSNIEQ